jgi:hypothetical protein
VSISHDALPASLDAMPISGMVVEYLILETRKAKSRWPFVQHYLIYVSQTSGSCVRSIRKLNLVAQLAGKLGLMSSIPGKGSSRRPRNK